MRYWPRRWTNRKEIESFSLHWALPTTSSDFKYSVCFKVNWDSIARRVRFQQTLNCNGQQRPLEHKTISNYSTLKSKVRMLFLFVFVQLFSSCNILSLPRLLTFFNSSMLCFVSGETDYTNWRSVSLLHDKIFCVWILIYC